MPRKSELEQKFIHAWDRWGFGGSDLTREYRIGEARFRYDFAWPSLRVAVEINGFGFGHQSIAAVDRDARKTNWAVFHGWLLLTYTSKAFSTQESMAEMIDDVCFVLSQRGRIDITWPEALSEDAESLIHHHDKDRYAEAAQQAAAKEGSG